MANLKDQIQQEITKERESSEKPGQTKRRAASEASNRLEEIRPRLDELPHTTDKYSLKAEYAVGPYASDIAIVELYDLNDIWVARWEISPTVGGSSDEWEITCKPNGADTYHEWFRNADDLLKYLTTSVAERIVAMKADEKMRKADVSQGVGIAANIGVIAGLLFLAYEIQQSNRIATATTEIELRNRWDMINHAIYTDPNVAELLVKAAQLDVEWSPTEQTRIAAILRNFGNIWLSVEVACSNALVPPATCDNIDDDIRDILRAMPGTWQVWRELNESRPSVQETRVGRTIGEFLEEVES